MQQNKSLTLNDVNDIIDTIGNNQTLANYFLSNQKILDENFYRKHDDDIKIDDADFDIKIIIKQNNDNTGYIFKCSVRNNIFSIYLRFDEMSDTDKSILRVLVSKFIKQFSQLDVIKVNSRNVLRPITKRFDDCHNYLNVIFELVDIENHILYTDLALLVDEIYEICGGYLYCQLIHKMITYPDEKTTELNLKNLTMPVQTINIARNIDLINNTKIDVVSIFPIYLMSTSNYIDLAKLDKVGSKSLSSILKNYQCNICRSRCNINNAIYTTKEYLGADICSICINYALQLMDPMPGWLFGSVYSLGEIVEVIRNRDNIIKN